MPDETYGWVQLPRRAIARLKVATALMNKPQPEALEILLTEAMDKRNTPHPAPDTTPTPLQPKPRKRPVSPGAPPRRVNIEGDPRKVIHAG